MLQPIDIQNLMNQCRVELLGVSDALIQSMLYQVATEFLNDTSLWTEAIPVQAVPDKRHYDLTPTEGQIIRLEGAANVSQQGGNYFVPGLMPEIGTFVATHAPNTDEQWLVHVVKNVSLPTLRGGVPIAPDWLLKVWFLGMKHGIIGELANQQDKSWSNAKSAAYHLSKFRKYIQDGRTIKLKANTSGASAWRFPQGYNSFSQQGGVPSFGGRERTF